MTQTITAAEPRAQQRCDAKAQKFFKISPSTLGFIYSDCQRCFIREVRDGARRPGMVPDVYNLADRAMKEAFGSVDAIEIAGVPRFTLLAQSSPVRSSPLTFGDYGVALEISGRLDAHVRLDDGRNFVVDYKTSVRPVDVDKYRMQLAAYAFALEMPHEADGEPPPIVDGLALLTFRPTNFAMKGARMGLYGPPEWREIERDDGETIETLRHVAALLAGAEQPRHNARCPYCIYYGAIPTPVGGAA